MEKILLHGFDVVFHALDLNLPLGQFNFGNGLLLYQLELWVPQVKFDPTRRWRQSLIRGQVRRLCELTTVLINLLVLNEFDIVLHTLVLRELRDAVHELFPIRALPGRFLLIIIESQLLIEAEVWPFELDLVGVQLVVGRPGVPKIFNPELRYKLVFVS